MRDIIRSELIRQKAPELHLAAQNIASPQIRSQATIAGNIANAPPCADSLAALLKLLVKKGYFTKEEVQKDFKEFLK